MSKPKCTVPGCGRKHQAKGYCNAHYKRLLAGDLLPDKPFKIVDPEQGCYIEECDRKHSALGLCDKHLQRLYRQEKKRQLVIEFGEKCFDCEKVYPDCVFEFDHIGTNKTINIGYLLGRTWDVIAIEAGKCEMVCSNCHQIRTWERMNQL